MSFDLASQMSLMQQFGDPPWKLNVGCGQDHMEGFINIDSEPQSKPDILLDIRKPWKMIPSKSVSAILAKHVLEHLDDLEVFFKEAYRVMLPDAVLEIKVPHPRSDSFLGDPTHVRPIIRNTLDLLSKRNCAFFHENNYSNTPLATYWNVDFETREQTFLLYDKWEEKFKASGAGMDEIMDAIETFNNVANEVNYILVRIKEQE